MAKIVYLREMATVVDHVARRRLRLKNGKMLAFTHDLAVLLTNHFGGEVGGVEQPDGEDPRMGCADYTAAIQWNKRVPRNGGVWQRYDRDVSFAGGERAVR